MKLFLLSCLVCFHLTTFAEGPAPTTEATMPEKIQGSERKVTIRITVEDLKLRAFLTWLEGGHLALNGEIVPLLLAFSQSLDNSELAGCRIANSAVSLSDSRGQQFDVVRVEEDLKGIPKVDIHTGAFTLACTKLEPGATFTWADIIKSTRGFLKIQPIDVR